MTDRELIKLMSAELSDRHVVRELTGLEELWVVTFEFHSRDERRHVASVNVIAEDIVQAINIVGEKNAKIMEKLHWSDYHIMSAVIVPELH